MHTELHCPCGYYQPLEADRLKAAFRCDRCGAELRFWSDPRGGADAACWLTVGGRTGPPRLAVPIPIAVALTIGGGPANWLAIPAEGVDERQAELRMDTPMRLAVRHLGGDGRTWINRARVYTGVVKEGDALRIGPYHMRLASGAALVLDGEGREPDVVVEEGEEPPPEGDSVAEDLGAAAAESGWTVGQKVRATACLVLILAAGVYLARTLVWPGVSADMPQETEFRCPVDGTRFRARWDDAAPKCPQCGQLCIGLLKYKSEQMGGFMPTSAPAREPSTSGRSGRTAPAETATTRNAGQDDRGKR